MKRTATVVALMLALAACSTGEKPWTAPAGTPNDGEKVSNAWAASQTVVTLDCKDGSKLLYVDAGSWRSTDRIFHAAAHPPYEPDFDDAIIGPCKGYSTTTLPAGRLEHPRLTKKQRDALIAAVRRDVKAAAAAMRCRSCGPYKSYLWLVQHRRGYTPLTKKELAQETKRVCALPAAQRNSSRTDIALILEDVASGKKLTAGCAPKPSN
jgi:hypothetical protein